MYEKISRSSRSRFLMILPSILHLDDTIKPRRVNALSLLFYAFPLLRARRHREKESNTDSYFFLKNTMVLSAIAGDEKARDPSPALSIYKV